MHSQDALTLNDSLLIACTSPSNLMETSSQKLMKWHSLLHEFIIDETINSIPSRQRCERWNWMDSNAFVIQYNTLNCSYAECSLQSSLLLLNIDELAHSCYHVALHAHWGRNKLKMENIENSLTTLHAHTSPRNLISIDFTDAFVFVWARDNNDDNW